MTTTVQRSLAALAASLAVAACGGKSEPGPAAPEPAEPTEPATPVEPAPPEETAPAPDPAEAVAELAAAERSAYELAQPVFQKHCARCHAKGGKKAGRKTLEHFDMTSYPFRGHHAGEITAEIRKVLAIGGGGKATMPKDRPGSVEGAELELIADWAEAHDRAAAGGAHGASGAEKAAGEPPDVVAL